MAHIPTLLNQKCQHDVFCNLKNSPCKQGADCKRKPMGQNSAVMRVRSLLDPKPDLGERY